MKSLAVLLAAIIFIGFLCSNSEGVDWKFYESSMDADRQSKYFFYDAESVEYLSDNVVRVWITGIKNDDLMKHIDDAINKKAATKIKSGYVPPYSVKNDKSLLSYTTFELVADLPTIKKNTAYMEVDCKAKRHRTIATRGYNQDGNQVHDDRPSEWAYVRPGSIERALRRIRCKGR